MNAPHEAQILRVAPPQLEQALTQIERSRAFRHSRRHRALLRHLVHRALSGDHASLKESVLAVEVFGRPASRFDPKTDTIVRVETRRLRQRLLQYYAGEGRTLPVRIELPVGSYVPLIAPRVDAAQGHESTRRARDLVERGQYFLRQPLSRTTLEQALERFDAALRESPESVAALVGIGRAWLNLGLGWHHSPPVAAEHAREALQRALALEPQQPDALVLLGVIAGSFERDARAAAAAFGQAIALAPASAFALQAFGSHLVQRGEFARAEAMLTQARRLDPMYINARMAMVNLRLGQGRLAEAQAELEALADLAPGTLGMLGLQGLMALEQGRHDEAVACYRQACAAAPGHANAVASLAAALGAAGRIDEADATMAALPRDPEAARVSPYVLAVVGARCGRAATAVTELERALRDGDPSAPMLATDPSLRVLHGHPRWASLVAASRRPYRLPVASGPDGSGRSTA